MTLLWKRSFFSMEPEVITLKPFVTKDLISECLAVLPELCMAEAATLPRRLIIRGEYISAPYTSDTIASQVFLFFGSVQVAYWTALLHLES